MDLLPGNPLPYSFQWYRKDIKKKDSFEAFIGLQLTGALNGWSPIAGEPPTDLGLKEMGLRGTCSHTSPPCPRRKLDHSRGTFPILARDPSF